jgi:triphosphoribosyl-dephospho-CoA synthase
MTAGGDRRGEPSAARAAAGLGEPVAVRSRVGARGAPPDYHDSDGTPARVTEASPSVPGARAAGLRARVAWVLAGTTVADAAELYAAIRRARPAGLGRAAAHDVRDTPTVTLRDAMALAADRDAVAREYATDFAGTFEVGAPALARARADGLAWDDAVVEAYLTLLAAAPDTHIARKLGAPAAAAVTARARRAVAAGGVRTAPGRRAVAALDRALRDARNASNPGTTADLTAASIFAHLLTGGWDARGERVHGDAHA